MGNRLPSARSKVRWHSPDAALIDHAQLLDEDLEWLRPATRLIVWAVQAPPGFYARLPGLQLLDVRGGSGVDASFLTGCDRLRVVVVNQVRGLSDLTALQDCESLEALDLYGLPQVSSLPMLETLTRLQWARLGSMKSLTTLDGLLASPGLRDLTLSRKMGVAATEARAIAHHPRLERFSWNTDGSVPDKVWVPFTNQVGKPKTTSMRPEHWLDLNG